LQNHALDQQIRQQQQRHEHSIRTYATEKHAELQKHVHEKRIKKCVTREDEKIDRIVEHHEKDANPLLFHNRSFRATKSDQRTGKKRKRRRSKSVDVVISFVKMHFEASQAKKREEEKRRTRKQQNTPTQTSL
jgi:hypothetical protein